MYFVSSIVVGTIAAVIVLFLGTIDNVSTTTTTPTTALSFSFVWTTTYWWSMAQWIPQILYNNNTQQINTAAWIYWENDKTNVKSHSNDKTFLEDIPIIYIQDHTVEDLLPYIESKYGKDWKKRPLLLKGLWTSDELNVEVNNEKNHRRLSLRGLLLENLTVPYFTDARKVGAITPDGIGTIQDIVANMTKQNAPYKIATQLLVQTYPELIEEVAPFSVVTTLFGSYFTPDSIRGSGPMRLFPAFTTVPLFIANSHPVQTSDTTGSTVFTNLDTDTDNNDTTQSSILPPPPHTALHCEPIGNVAVQLSGEKLWTLIRPEYSKLLRPMIAPDGRAFFVSSLPIHQIILPKKNGNNNNRIPYYSVITEAGDALWVPTWTWHRVDYVANTTTRSSSSHDSRIDTTNREEPISIGRSTGIAIGASLFHFRPIDFIQNNPLYAFLIIPAIVLELIGYKTQ